MEGYARAVRRTLWGVLALNLAVVGVKALAAFRSGSLSVAADGLHSALDAGNNVIALLVLRAATAPPDEDHPWGHGKFETVAAFVVSGLLFLTAFEILERAVVRIAAPAPLQVDALTVGLMGATLVVNFVVAGWETRVGRKLGSDLLLADSAHTRADVLVTVAVLGGLGLSAAGVTRADPVLAVAVAGVIGWTGWGIFKRTVPVLTDKAVFGVDEVRRVVQRVPGVVGVHDIRSRGRRGEAFVQMHLVVEPDDVLAAHRITEEVERALERELGVKEAVIHVEPEDDSGPA